MGEHLTLEELTAFLQETETGPDAVARIARINAHLLHCDACSALFDTVSSLLELSGTLAQQAAHTDWTAALSRCAARFRLRLRDAARQLLLDQVHFGDADFDYPLPVGARAIGSHTASLDTLIDNENSYNELSVHDGTLSVRLDAEEISNPQPVAALLTEDGQIAAAQPMTLDGEVWTASFPVEDGSYDLAIL